MMFGLSENTIAIINGVFKKYPQVTEVVIYGSRAKGNYRTGSDIDLTLRGEGLNQSILSRIKMALDELHTPYIFDISLFAALNSPGLEEHIKRVGKVFYLKR